MIDHLPGDVLRRLPLACRDVAALKLCCKALCAELPLRAVTLLNVDSAVDQPPDFVRASPAVLTAQLFKRPHLFARVKTVRFTTIDEPFDASLLPSLREITIDTVTLDFARMAVNVTASAMLRNLSTRAKIATLTVILPQPPHRAIADMFDSAARAGLRANRVRIIVPDTTRHRLLEAVSSLATSDASVCKQRQRRPLVGVCPRLLRKENLVRACLMGSRFKKGY